MGAEAAAWLATYQTAIVGLIGFLGVVVTLFASARAARQQELATRREDWARILEDRKHRRRGMERALLAELRVHRHAIADALNDLRRRPKGDTDPVVVPIRETAIFDNHLEHIGLLPAEVLDKILPAFLALRECGRRVSILSPPTGAGVVFVVPPEHIVELVLIWKDVLDNVDSAIASVEAALAAA